MSVISRIESMMEEYSSAERKLANYIINHVEKIPTMTANDLAEAAGSSAPTVVRFSKKIGFQSLTDFKITVSTELQTGLVEGLVILNQMNRFIQSKINLEIMHKWQSKKPLIFWRKKPSGLLFKV